jgi:hypothetical protein
VPINLREARNKGEIAKFVKEHKRDPKGDATAFNSTLEAMAGSGIQLPLHTSTGAYWKRECECR